MVVDAVLIIASISGIRSINNKKLILTFHPSQKLVFAVCQLVELWQYEHSDLASSENQLQQLSSFSNHPTFHTQFVGAFVISLGSLMSFLPHS